MKKREVCNNNIIREVAQELGLRVDVVKEIVNCQSEYTVMVMESNTFDSIRWPYFGVFKSKPFEVQIVNQMKGLSPQQQQEFRKQIRSKKYVDLSNIT